MGHNNDEAKDVPFETLAQLFQEYKSLPLPRTNGKFDPQEANVDLYIADSYIAGLVDTFLCCKKISQRSIVLDSSIDSRLDNYFPASPEEVAIIAAFKAYRTKMVELALALSQISGVPVEWK